MAVKDILLALTSYPEPTPISAVTKPSISPWPLELEFRLSLVRSEMRSRGILADPLLDVPALAAAEAKKSSNNAETLCSHSKMLQRNREFSRNEYWSIV